uniref:Uncharacterized protein n=1 Tax=Aegilops tauschii subsp. strangulata TaxID=200361 RepID=A0A453PG65_AEGTS
HFYCLRRNANSMHRSWVKLVVLLLISSMACLQSRWNLRNVRGLASISFGLSSSAKVGTVVFKVKYRHTRNSLN